MGYIYICRLCTFVLSIWQPWNQVESKCKIPNTVLLFQWPAIEGFSSPIPQWSLFLCGKGLTYQNLQVGKKKIELKKQNLYHTLWHVDIPLIFCLLLNPLFVQWIVNLKPAFGGDPVLTMVTIEQKNPPKNFACFKSSVETLEISS
jgi:hypothetical protein